jgi:hypothetical protein
MCHFCTATAGGLSCGNLVYTLVDIASFFSYLSMPVALEEKKRGGGGRRGKKGADIERRKPV